MKATLKTVKIREVHFLNTEFIAKGGFSEAIKTKNSEIKTKTHLFLACICWYRIRNNRQKKAGQRSTKVEFDKSSH